MLTNTYNSCKFAITMLLRFLIILTIFFFSKESPSQILSFDNTYTAPTNAYAVKMVHCSDKGYATVSRISIGADWFYFQKTDSNGVLLWAKIIEDTSFQKVDPQQVIETNDRGFCITAALRTPPNTTNVQGTAIIKLDSSGNLLWQKSLFEPNYRQEGRGIAEDTTGALYLCFDNYQTPQGNPPAEILILKLSASGQYIWTRRTNITSYLIQRIELTSKSRLALCGNHRVINETKIIVLDTAGNHLFSHRFTINDTLTSTTQDWIVRPNGMPYALLNIKGAGATYYRLDSSGTLLSGTEINYTVPITAVALNKDTSNPIGLIYESSTGKAILTDLSTSSINAIEIGGATHFKPVDFYRNASGSVVVWGGVPNTVAAPQNPRLIKTQSSPNSLPVNGCTVIPFSLSTNSATLTDSTDITQFLPAITVFSPLNLTSLPLNVNTIVNCTISDIQDLDVMNNKGLFLYPNPVNDQISIHPRSDETYLFNLYDITGKCVLSQKFDSATEINVSAYTEGIYIYTIRTENFYQNGKLVICH